MMRSLFSGISGLRNHQTRMDVIGNNIANVNTMGFKSSRVSFQETFNQTLRGASSPSGESGGTDPLQIGLGMAVASIDMLNSPGNIQTTGLLTDMALQGEGYFVVSDGTTNYYTRAGDFKTDGADYLSNSKGFMVMGWSAIDGAFGAKTPATLTPLRIQVGKPEGTEITGSAWATSSREWVLDISGAVLRDGLSEKDLTVVGLPEGLTFSATKDTSANRIVLRVEGEPTTLAFSPAVLKVAVKESAVTASDALTSPPFELFMQQVSEPVFVPTNPVVVMNADGTTISQTDSTWILELTSGELKDTLSAADLDVTGLPSGLQVTAKKDGASNRILLTVSGTADTELVGVENIGVSLKGSALKEAGAQDSAPHTLELHPAGGTTVIAGKILDRTIALDARNTQSNPNDSWEIEITRGTLDWPLEPENPGDPLPVTVTGLPSGLQAVITQGSSPNRVLVELQGTADEPVSGPVTATLTFWGGAITETPATESVEFPLEIASRTSPEPTTVYMDAYNVDSTGTITGSFSDGTSRAIGQVAIAMFSNPGGLVRAGDGLYELSNNSGEADLGTAGRGGRGLIAPSSLEMSNVDLAWEFTNMIITQRGFQANSRVITTSDEMLQELANLKR